MVAINNDKKCLHRWYFFKIFNASLVEPVEVELLDVED
jgi:hypothetical protein